jgi:hypothetical protein
LLEEHFLTAFFILGCGGSLAVLAVAHSLAWVYRGLYER